MHLISRLITTYNIKRLQPSPIAVILSLSDDEIDGAFSSQSGDELEDLVKDELQDVLHSDDEMEDVFSPESGAQLKDAVDACLQVSNCATRKPGAIDKWLWHALLK